MPNKKQSANNNCTWFNGFVTRENREKLHNHKGAVVWFTGLSASGKSTISHHLEKRLFEKGCSTYVFDGDNVRHGLCSDLEFSKADRTENIRRIGEMARLFIDAGIIAITAFISPYQKDREQIRSLVSDNQFLEIYVKCPIDICENRDQKGIYAKAKSGIIKEFTGISAPYEPPGNPNIVIRSDELSPVEAAKRVMSLMEQKEII
ncbi:MAG: adenylyl-sulfate kinase [Desulfobacterales bacterium]|jgi:adenylylsulfate kinase|nr:adenylyl-sulfate kinase [Desulfobacterales bacterium]MDP6681496.1 adenylyl-sulfate kinase [Desulfobacterales bacterium]MDP6808868.1 adenylyl-sulfate kinase [Desulfobacterales bacterium]|tara:strand:- start:19 stop:633 length:615 start_codon:yes stop_codon:yes gene_type:complete